MKTYLSKRSKTYSCRRRFFDKGSFNNILSQKENNETFFKPVSFDNRRDNTQNQIHTDTINILEQKLTGPINPVNPTHCLITKAKFVEIPSSKLACSFIEDNRYGAAFDMNVHYESKIPCSCRYGEYRQYVRGYFKHNDEKVNHKLCGQTLDETSYKEDCRTVKGNNYKFGYHSTKFKGSYFDNPDQSGGCDFNGHDEVGISGATKGDTVELKLDFIGNLVDASSDKTLKTASWSVEGKGTVP